MKMDIFGIFASNGFPMMELLSRDFQNTNHVNFVEIARAHFFDPSHNRRYDGIYIVFENSEGRMYTF